MLSNSSRKTTSPFSSSWTYLRLALAGTWDESTWPDHSEKPAQSEMRMSVAGGGRAVVGGLEGVGGGAGDAKNANLGRRAAAKTLPSAPCVRPRTHRLDLPRRELGVGRVGGALLADGLAVDEPAQRVGGPLDPGSGGWWLVCQLNWLVGFA